MTDEKIYRISLTGDLGSGKSTVGEIIAERLKIEKFTLGTIQRKVAEEHNMTTTELNRYMEDKPEMEDVFDNWQRAFEQREGSFIIDSRLGFHFVPSTFSYYLSVDINESARRIMNANRSSEPYSSVEEAVSKINERRESERLRFKKFYGVDILDMSNYDCIIDTTNRTPEEVAEEIIKSYRQKADK